MEALAHWIEAIIAIIMFTTLVEMISPEGNMKKYILLISGLLVITSIINPVVGILRGGVSLDDLVRVNEARINIHEIEAKSKLISAEQNREILSGYREGLAQDITARISEGGYRVRDIKLDIEEGSEGFGRIKKLAVGIEDKVEGEIEPIGDISLQRENTLKAKKEILEKLSSIYQLEPESIEVKVY